jgi:hypothetical protein
MQPKEQRFRDYARANEERARLAWDPELRAAYLNLAEHWAHLAALQESAERFAQRAKSPLQG